MRREANDRTAGAKGARAAGDRYIPHDDQLRGSLIPVEAIWRARFASVVGYCERNKIELTTNKNGKRALHGRDYVEVDGPTWTNTRNRTQGSAIDFAAVHGNLTYLQAIARVGDAPGLLEVEKHFGAVNRKYSSFHVPHRHEVEYPVALERMGRFLTSFGSKREAGDALLKSDQARVGRNGLVSLYPKNDTYNALDFAEGADGQWQSKRRGKFNSPFHASRGTGSSLVVFTDPKQYIQKRGLELFADRKRKNGILVLMEPNEEAVVEHVKRNPHVKEIEIVTTSPSKPAQGELDFFGNLKSKLTGLDVNVRFTGQERALTRRGLELSL